MRDIPDAPWIGKCKEDYYGYDDEEDKIRCDCCDEEIYEEDAIKVDGVTYCRNCYEEREETDDEELYG